ncbi:MAG TPA: PQQ-dependent sugar dehydrogenase, partial [Planctomycetota bacterium]|nr:PQQ-dependent sugar dehydrogenase [Planctomycetota bacterium]
EPGTNNLLLLHQLWPWGGAGRLLRIKDDKDVSDYQVLLAPDGIMYGIAFDPQFEQNGYMYIGWNGPLSQQTKYTRVTRYTISRDEKRTLDPKSEHLIIEWESDGHNGGDLAFGKDGMLYISSGDGTSDSDKNLTGQDLTKLLSKILRIDVRNSTKEKPYTVPADNPFVNRAGTRPETWAYGMRNPWRLTTDPKTGHVWVGQNGQDLWEQVYLIQKGHNYGWSVSEGAHPFYPDRKRGPEPITKPTAEHPHSEARSLTGGQVYYGNEFPELRGMYIYGDWSTGKIWAIRHDGEKLLEHRELADTTMRICGFGFDSKGELLIADWGAGYFRLERNPPPPPTAKGFPQKLSETGVFASVKGHIPHAAAVPYSVNAQLWSDGAHKERFFLMPGADSKIDYTGDRGFEFPEGAVLVKSFGLEREHGNPKSLQWIETRLLTKTLGKWVGYSYEWNAEQTDAVLVAKEGVDREFSIRDASAAGGVRRLPWHYPSRTECMVCHSRAFNFVLGVSEGQINKLHDYGGVVDNQLRTLEHLGMLRVKWRDFERSTIWKEARAAGKTEKEAGEWADRLCSSRMQREPVYSSLLPKNPERCEQLVDPYDEKQDLNKRARSYLHANCSQCHVEAGGGNAMMELEYKQPLDKMRIFDVKPMHSTFDKPEARLIAPGDPNRSIIFHRMSMRGSGQMPPLATTVVDERAVKLMKEWISQLKP